MLDKSVDSAALFLAIAAFVAVLLLAEGLAQLWRKNFGHQARRLGRRLEQLQDRRDEAPSQLLRQQRDAHSLLDKLTQRSGAHQRLSAFLWQADVSWGPGTLLGATVLLGLAAYAAADVLARQAGLVCLLAGALAAAAPWLYLLRKRRLRLALLQAQLPEALDLMARAMLAGHAFGSSLQMVAQEMPDPIAAEFRVVHDEVNFGMSLHQAFAGLTERVPLTDLRYFAVAVLIQRESGGNLSELLGRLAQVIRDRLKLLARVRVLSSEGRLSSWILVCLPFALGGLLAYFNPEFMKPLWTDPLGISILKWMLGFMVLGVVLIQKIVRLRV